MVSGFEVNKGESSSDLIARPRFGFCHFTMVTGLLGLLGVVFMEGGDRLQIGDLGPKGAPIVLGSVLFVGGLVLTMVERWKHSIEKEEAINELNDQSSSMFSLDILLIIGYLLCLPLLGFGLSTIVWGIALLRRGGQRWLRIGISLGVLLLLIYALFGGLFKVRLPAGVLGLG